MSKLLASKEEKDELARHIQSSIKRWNSPAERAMKASESRVNKFCKREKVV